jgi:hypothetical protein
MSNSGRQIGLNHRNKTFLEGQKQREYLVLGAAIQ